MIGDKLERRNRLNSSLILEKTPGERNFAAQVDHLLSRIKAPEYRQLCSECLLSLMAFVEANPEVRFEDDLALDVVIGHAVRVGWQQSHPSLRPENYPQHKAQAWGQFYRPHPVTAAAGSHGVAGTGRTAGAGVIPEKALRSVRTGALPYPGVQRPARSGRPA